MKKFNGCTAFFLMLLFLSCTGPLKSQQVVASAGNQASGGSMFLNWTVGEPVAGTLQAGSSILTQGVHQVMIVVDAIGEWPEPGFTVSAYPNPATSCVILEFLHPEQHTGGGPWGRYCYRLYDLDGKLLKQAPVDDPVSVIRLDDLSRSSVFILQIVQKDGKALLPGSRNSGAVPSPVFKTFKIIKQ